MISKGEKKPDSTENHFQMLMLKFFGAGWVAFSISMQESKEQSIL